MNIVFAYPTEFNPQKGGVERVTELLAKALSEKGFKIYYLNWKRGVGCHSQFANVTYLPSDNLKDESNIEFYNTFLLENKIDVVINQHGLYEGTIFLSQIENKNVKLISVLHSDPLGYYNNLFRDLLTLKNQSLIEKFKRVARVLLYWKVKRTLYRSITKHYGYIEKHPQYLCLLSSYYKAPLKKICKIPDSYFISIPNPNTYDCVQNFPLSKERIVLFVGRLDNSSKKLNILIDIWLKIEKLHSDWKLVIVGDGPDKDSIFQKARKSQKIHMVGWQDPQPYYERASIFTMTSIFEGFPMCLTEAMQWGCVPIAFDSFPAVHDIIKPGETGELVKAFDKHLYVKKLSHLMTDEGYRERLSRQGFEYVKKFDIANILPKWVEIIER